MKQIWTARAAAERLGLSVSTLAKWRVAGEGPKWIKLGNAKVAYDEADLIEWLDSRKRQSTSEPADAA